MQVAVGNVVEGKVTGITNFGAFIQLPEGKTGLVHISEVSNEYVKNINDHLKENQIVSVKILTIEPNGKISLSIRKAIPAEAGSAAGHERSFAPSQYSPVSFSHGGSEGRGTFEDKLKKFIKDSDEKQGDVKRNFESKRGGGWRK